MPWIAFTNLKNVQVTFFDLLKLCPPFVRLSFALGCHKPAVSKAEHLQKLSTLEVRETNLVGQVFEARKSPLRKKKEISNMREDKREKFNS